MSTTAQAGPWPACQQSGRGERRALGRNALCILAGSAVYGLSQWVMVVALARLGDAAQVGEFALGWSVAGPVFLLAQFQLRALLSTDATGEFAWADYLGHRLIAMLAALLIVTGLSLAYGASGTVIIAIGLAKSFEGFSDLVQAWWQKGELSERIGLSQGARGLCALTCGMAGLMYWGGAQGAAIGVAVGTGLVLAGYDLPLLRGTGISLKPAFVWPRLATLSRLAVPLGVCMMLISLQTNLPRLAVERQGGSSALGVFAAMAYLVTAGGMVINAAGSAASPRLARAAALGDRAAFYRVLRLFLALALLGGAAAVSLALLGGARLLGTLYGPAYAAQSAAFVWIMLAGAIGFVSSVYGFAATALRRLDQQPFATAGALVILASACAFLIPRWGLAGAGMAMNLAALFNLVAWRRLAAWRAI